MTAPSTQPDIYSATYFPKLLRDMPDGWGKDWMPDLHPSGTKYPHCARWFMFAKRLGWTLPQWREPLNIGHVFHACMALIRNGSDPDLACQSVYSSSMQTLAEEQAQWAMDHEGADLPIRYKWEKAISMGVMLAKVWNNHYPLRAGWHVLAVEQTITMDLSDVSPFLEGKLTGTVDTVMRQLKNDKFWLEDHKTTSMSPTTRAEGLTFDIQAHLYRALWEAAHPEAPLSGVLHNIIRKPTIRQRKQRQPETVEEYVKRAFEWYEEQFLKDPNDPPMAQSVMVFMRPRLHEDVEMLNALKGLCELHYQKRLLLQNFPRVGYSYGGCHGNFGSVCQYMPLCECEDPAHWYRILQERGFLKANPDNRDRTDES